MVHVFINILLKNRTMRMVFKTIDLFNNNCVVNCLEYSLRWVHFDAGRVSPELGSLYNTAMGEAAMNSFNRSIVIYSTLYMAVIGQLRAD